MKQKFMKIIKKGRVIILMLFLLFALIAIHPNPYADGVAVRSVSLNSSASSAGFVSPKSAATPMSRERIVAVNGKFISSIEEYKDVIAKMQANQTYTFVTNKDTYRVKTRYITSIVVTGELEWRNIQVTSEEDVNGTLTNVTRNVTRQFNKTITTLEGMEDIGLTVYNAPKTNIRKGLDLQGGTRVLLQPEKVLTSDEMDNLLANMGQRLNVFGLSDIIIREASDLSGNQYILVEVAGVNEEEVKELISKQGKFEAKIANSTVFRGGGDITHVCRTAQCSGIDPTSGCGQVEGGGWSCRFRFSITMTPEAADRQAAATRELEVIAGENGGEYLSEQILFFLDDVEVDSLNIGVDLRGKSATDIQISGSGNGRTQQEAVFGALKNMKKLQTVLITGSLPVKLNIVKTDNLSPLLGDEFVRNALFVGILAIAVVAFVVFLRYRRFSVAIPILISSASEVILLLGFAALVGWNIDLVAIAGIIIAVGTGVDHLIIITDEVLSNEGDYSVSWNQKVKNAFSIIIVAYFTTMVAMMPLLFAGAGLLKGFALTTMAGITFGVFITRPAYAVIVEILINE